MSDTCQHCGKPVGPRSVDGLCPECLLRVGLGTLATGGARAFEPPPPEELRARFPQFEILELLGRGGMGAVYKARQRRLGRLVALKILPPEVGADPAFAQRFEREARALAQLNHPNIVTLYEFGEADGLYYFLMEYVDGASLRQLLQAGRVAPREALAIVPQICDALQYAHDAGIVHRDIKPENILLDRQGRVKVADFGLAKLVRSPDPADRADPSAPSDHGRETTHASLIMGTPQYMAPEQVAHPSTVDHRADIYSLGVVFYQMLTGELPKGDPAAPSKRVVIDVRLDEVVLRALEKRPELRYQQVSDVKTMVETIATTPPAMPATKNWQPPDAGWGWLIGKMFGMTFTSATAFRLANASALGFLGFLACIGFVDPRLRFCFGFAGFFGSFGLVGVAIITELAARRRGAARMSAGANPLPVTDFWQAMEAGDYARAWEKTAPYFQRDIGQADWVRQMETIRRPLGKAVSRQQLSMLFLNAGTRFEQKNVTAFESRQAATETVICALQPDGEWRIEKYGIENVRPADTAGAADSQPSGPSLTQPTPGWWRLPLVVSLLLYATFVAFLIITAPTLPDRVASHFGANGEPNGWMSRAGHLLFLSLFPLAIGALFAGIASLTRKLPAGLINIPRKDYWLTPERRALTASILGVRLAWFYVLLLGFFAGLHALTIVANRTQPAQLPMGGLLLLVMGFLIATMIWVILLITRFAEVNRASAPAPNTQAGLGAQPAHPQAPHSASPRALVQEVRAHLSPDEKQKDILLGFSGVAVLMASIFGINYFGPFTMLGIPFAFYLFDRHLAFLAATEFAKQRGITLDQLRRARYDAKRQRLALLAIVPVALVGVLLGFALLNSYPQAPHAPERPHAAPAPVARSWHPLAAHVGNEHGTVFVTHDNVDVIYALYYPGQFGTRTDESYNPKLRSWHSKGAVELASGKKFLYLRTQDSPNALRLNGDEFDLLQGRVIVLHDDGTAEQLKLFPSLGVAREPERLADHLSALER